MSHISSSLHDKVIPYSRLKQNLPDRIKFLNPQDREKIDNTIKQKEPIMFLPTYLLETSMQDEMYEKAKYKIILMGVFQDGRKVNIILDDIDPYFEIRIPDGSKESQLTYIQELMDLLDSDETTKPFKKTVISARPFRYYQPNKSKFLRVFYQKTKTRVAAINLVRRNGYETTSDDLASYYRVVCRDNLTTFSSWAMLTDYKPTSVNFLKGETYRVKISKYKQFTGELTSDLLKDRTMSCCWDIETWSKSGNVPIPDNPDDNVFCISMTFQWVNELDPFFKVCICDLPANAKPGYLTIVAGSEKNIIKAFSDVFALMRPEFIFGFNDSDYDWNWIIKRSKQYKNLLSYIATELDSTNPYKPYTDDVVFKYSFKKEHVKVEADTYVDGYSLMMHGYIPIDVRTIFRRLYPTAEKSSLSWFLAKNKLGGKEDMPYERMFKIYQEYITFIHAHENELDDIKNGRITDFDTSGWESEEVRHYNELKEQLAEINHYCVVDAQRCHDLVKIRSVIMDHREVSNLSYTSVYDAFYRANGMKVRNLTIAIGQTNIFGIRFSNITNTSVEEGKYPGAFVFPPKKGLKITKLSMEERIKKAELTQNSIRKDHQEWLNTTVEELDCYKSIIKKYGAVMSEDVIDKLENNNILGPKPLPNKFKQFWSERIGRPIAGLDFSSLYPSLIRTYNFSPEYCILDKKQAMELHNKGQRITKVDFLFNGRRRLAYFVWHNNKYNPNESDFQFGVYPYILDDLFNKRSILKKKMKLFDIRKEEIEAMPADKRELPEIINEYSDVVFNKNYLNSKQNALKVFMNTFYGEAGNKLSPFFVLEVAGGVTTYGQKNIKFAYAYVKEQNCEVYYGDTDSLYISMPEKVFEKIDTEYYVGNISKIDYWTQLVEISFKEIKAIQDGVNRKFIEDNGTKFLSMAYEEFLYPVAFTAKKKYFGIAHEHIANFTPKELFIRGLEVKKRGVSEILRKIFMEIMWAVCTPNNLYDLLELVCDKIDEIYNRKWTSHDFIQTGVYRTGKKNVKICTFVERMRQRGIHVKPNERFNYVLVKKYPYTYDLRGRKKEISVGDKIEYADVAERDGMEIDLDYYMEGSINGQLARLITYHDMFLVEALDNSDAETKTAEEAIYANACKFITSYCKKYYAKYNVFSDTHQKIYKTANKATSKVIKEFDDLASDLLCANVNYDDFETWFVEYTEKHADKLIKDYGKNFVMSELDKLSNLIRTNNTIREATKRDDEAESRNDEAAKSDSDAARRDSEAESRNDDAAKRDSDADRRDRKAAKRDSDADRRDSEATGGAYSTMSSDELKKIIKLRREEKLKDLQCIYYGNGKNSFITARELAYSNTMSILRKRLRENLDTIMKIYNAYNKSLESIMSLIKSKIGLTEDLYKPTNESIKYKLEDFNENILEELNEEIDDQAKKSVIKILNDDKSSRSLDGLKALYNNMLTAHLVIKRSRDIVSYLKLRRDHSNKIIIRPDDEIIKNTIKNDIESTREELMQLNI